MIIGLVASSLVLPRDDCNTAQTQQETQPILHFFPPSGTFAGRVGIKSANEYIPRWSGRGPGQRGSPPRLPGHRNPPLEAKETTEYTIGGQSLSLTRFQYSLSGTDLSVVTDNTGKIYSVEWPARKASFVRKGYEGLLLYRRDLKSAPQL
jgi:hypothetical protein